MGIRGAEPPSQIALWAIFDGFADQLDPEASAAVVGKDVDVAKVCDVHLVGEDRRETNLAILVVEADHTGRFPNRAFDILVRAALSPVRVVAQVAVDRIDIDPVAIIVELKALA